MRAMLQHHGFLDALQIIYSRQLSFLEVDFVQNQFEFVVVQKEGSYHLGHAGIDSGQNLKNFFTQQLPVSQIVR